MACYLDNDAFVKLVSCGVLERALDAIGSNLNEVHILPTFFYRFLTARRPRTVTLFGEDVVTELSRLSDRFRRVAYELTDEEFRLPKGAEPYTIDPGEAILFFAAKHDPLARVVTADKRCISALSIHPQFRYIAESLQGRVICLEQIFLYMIERGDFDHLKSGVCNHIARIRHKKVQDEQSLRSAFGMEHESRMESVVDCFKSTLLNFSPYDYDVLDLASDLPEWADQREQT